MLAPSSRVHPQPSASKMRGNSRTQSLDKQPNLLWRIYGRGYTFGIMPQVTAWAKSKGSFVYFLDALLRGLGQVIFINNPFTGVLVIVAAIVNSYYHCLMGLLGLVCSTGMAHLLGFDEGAIQAGIFGYNGYLVGTALALFSPGWGDNNWSPTMIIPVVVCSALSSIVASALAHLFTRISDTPIPVFTLPFHVITWMWLLGAQQYASFPANPSPALAVPVTVTDRALISYDRAEIVKSVFVGIAQVFFMERFESGVILIMAVFAASFVSFTAALLGAILGTLMAMGLGIAPAPIYQGLWGYNPVLAAIAIGGMFFHLNRRTTALATLAALLSILLTGAVGSFLKPVGLPPLTFPAAITAVMFCLMGNNLPKDKPLIPATVTVPEDRLKPAPAAHTVVLVV
eukprot:m.39250 g.39250  ORF g.39250 m.39250 type:complete len:400 (+) comp10112_c0_seq2:295-1494(+)